MTAVFLSLGLIVLFVNEAILFGDGFYVFEEWGFFILVHAILLQAAIQGIVVLITFWKGSEVKDSNLGALDGLDEHL